MDINLRIPSNQVRTFLELAGETLAAARSETTFGSLASEHRFYAAAMENDEVRPVIVVLSVRRVRQREQVFVSDVRPPNSNELSYVGLTEEPRWRRQFKREAREAVLDALGKAKEQLSSRKSIEQYRRGHLAYHGSPIRGEYWLGDWRLAPASDTGNDMFGEHILLCDRVLSEPTPNQILDRFSSGLNELGDLLTVFWMKRFYGLGSDFIHVIEQADIDGQATWTSRRAQRGYIDSSTHERMPLPGEDDEPGETMECDRMDPLSCANFAARPFRPPADATSLFTLYQQADFGTAMRFRQAAKAYRLSDTFAADSMTAAIAYLVVAAESLSDIVPQRCESCGEVRGVFQATREFFFRELPCLREQESATSSLLKRAYDIRSRHFHDARFASDELNPHSLVEILLPPAFEAGTVHEILKALVNSLLVAWLTRMVSGKMWARALQPPPRQRQRRYFSFSARI